MSAVSPAKLPLWPTVRDSFVVTVRHAGIFFRFAWPVLVALAVSDAVSAWLSFPGQLRVRADSNASEPVVVGFELWSAMASILGGACLAVLWHRYIVGKFEPTSTGLFEQRGRVLAYFGWVLLSIVPFALAVLPAIALILLSDLSPSWSILALAPILSLVALIPFFRYVLIFPAAALGHEARLRSVSYATRGNAEVLAFGTYFSALPSFLIMFLIDPTQADDRLVATVLTTAGNFVHMVAGMPIVTFLSLAYLHFAEAIRDAAARDDDIASGTGG
jgi:hypothetical protein